MAQKKHKNLRYASKPLKTARVMVFGTFDILHPGHLNFFLQAKALSRNSWLIVSVARDGNVEKIKGRRPQNTERQRLDNIRKCKLVNAAVLGAPTDYISHILKIKPQIIALGYDQTAYTKGLRQKLAAKGLTVKVIRLKAFRPSRFKTSLIKRARPVDR